MNALKHFSLVLSFALALTGCNNKDSRLDDFNRPLYIPE